MKQSFMQGAQRPNAPGMHPAMHELVSDRLGNRALWILDALYAAYCAGPLRAFRTEHENYRPCASLRHPADHRLGAEKRPVGVDLQLKVKVLLGDLQKRFAQIALEVVEHGRQIEPAPTDHPQVGKVRLPELIGCAGWMGEAVALRAGASPHTRAISAT